MFFPAVICLSILLPQQTPAQEHRVPDTTIASARQLRSLMQSDPHRPIFHFVAPEGHAMPFDPNGGIYWKGRYHLGYIYQSFKNNKKEHVWGHAVSTDLLHWTLYPDMLNVQPGDIEKGIFSGGAFLSREGIPHIMYHGEGSATNLVAYSTDDDLRHWKKFDGNPVLRTTLSDDPRDPKEGKYTAWDPEGWFDPKADAYYQISGGNVPALFKSRDMYDWKYLGDLIQPGQRYREKSEDVSCPDMFTIGNKKMLLFISHNIGTQYYLGDFNNDRFTVEKHGRMNWPGGTFFAPEQLQDDQGRNIIWGWVLERKPKHLRDYGWSGIMSLPRVLNLSPSGELEIHPARELEKIRLDSIQQKQLQVAARSETVLPINGTSMEMQLTFSRGQQGIYGIKVFCSSDGKEETKISYDPVKEELVIDFVNSSAGGPVKMPSHCIFGPTLEGFPATVAEQRAPLKLKPGEPLRLQIFIDRSIIEVFANGRQCMTQVVYPEMASSNQVKVFTTSAPLQVREVKAWKMAATNAY